MSDPIDPEVSDRLAAWRADSRRQPRPQPREGARDAMLAALASRLEPARRRSRVLSFQPRFRRAWLAAGSAAVIAALAVGAIGWNAPAGSPLYGVRTARQSVMLKLPGANLAALHLQFAEQDLGDARARIDPAASLAHARAELTAAVNELPANRTSPLWVRYDSDEATLVVEEAELEAESHVQAPRASPSRAPEGETPGGATAPQVSGSVSTSPATGPSGSGERQHESAPTPGASAGTGRDG